MSIVDDRATDQGWIDLTKAWAIASQTEIEPVDADKPAVPELPDDVSTLMNIAVESESYAVARRRIAYLAVCEADRAIVGAAVAQLNANIARISYQL